MNILDHRLIAIVRGIGEQEISQVVQALVDGGISLIEIPLGHGSVDEREKTLHIIRKINREFGGKISLGAGTVLNVEDADLSVKAGAQYIISPNVNIEVIRRTKELGKISMPGALTPTEIVHAYENGADIIKIFPAGNMGEPYMKALRGPLGFIPFAAVGGVDLENAARLLKSGYKMVAVGSNLIDKHAIRKGNFERIKKLAQEYVKTVSEYND